MINRALVKQAIVAGALGLWLLAAGAAAQTSATQQGNAAKDLAIMSRILEKRLGDDFKEEVIATSLFQRGIQGFYVPGVGAMFFIDVRFPVAQPPVEKPSSGTQRRDDLWSRFEREMETRGAGYPSPTFTYMPAPPPGASDPSLAVEPMSGRAPFSKAKVERLTAGLFDVLAQYGNRIGVLSDSERLVIVVSGSGERLSLAPPLAVTTSEHLSVVTRLLGAAPDEAGEPATAGVSPESIPRATMALDFEARGRRTAGSVLILSAPRKGLADDPKELAKRATVSAYTY